MTRKSAEHLAMGSWLLPILCCIFVAAAHQAHLAVYLIVILAALAFFAGLVVGIIALRQASYFGKRHIFGHAAVGITLNAFFIIIVIIYAFIVFVPA
jgi:hypothetical protein